MGCCDRLEVLRMCCCCFRLETSVASERFGRFQNGRVSRAFRLIFPKAVTVGKLVMQSYLSWLSCNFSLWTYNSRAAPYALSNLSTRA